MNAASCYSTKRCMMWNNMLQCEVGFARNVSFDNIRSFAHFIVSEKRLWLCIHKLCQDGDDTLLRKSHLQTQIWNIGTFHLKKV